MMNMLRLFTIALLLTVTACSSIVTTSVSTFRAPESNSERSTIKISAENPKLKNSLEFEHYRNKLAKHLSAEGFSPTQEADAEWVALLDYRIEYHGEDTSRQKIYVGAATGYRSGLSGGVVVTSPRELDNYLREVIIKIGRNVKEPTVSDKLIEVYAKSQGNCEHLSVVFDEMLDAIFKNFMRDDGSVERINIASKKTSCRSS